MPELLTDLRQRHLEAYEARFNELAPEGIGAMKGQTRVYGALLRSAAVGGWFGDGYDEEWVDNLTFQEVAPLAEAVATKYAELTRLPD
jgi:hypothetical protein